METIIWVLVLGLIPAFIAKGKGRDFVTWYMYGALLFIVALIHSIVMKDKSGLQCPACKEYISENAVVCKHCHTAIADFAKKDSCEKS